MSPDVRLVRDEVTKKWVQLQDILLLKALQGVKVYILLYREVKTVLPDLKSQDVKVGRVCRAVPYSAVLTRV